MARERISAMLRKLTDFIERHPYLPIVVMVVLDVAGYAFESDQKGEQIKEWDFGAAWVRLREAFSSTSKFMELFPEEIFVFFTAYSLSHKMRTVKEQEAAVEGVVDKLTQTGRFLESIWARGDSRKLLGGDDAAGDQNAADQANRAADKQ